MSFIKNRLRRLESATRKGPSGWCSACGLPPDGPGYVVYDRIPEGAEEVCLVCGRRLWFVIGVGDAETGGGRGVSYERL